MSIKTNTTLLLFAASLGLALGTGCPIPTDGNSGSGCSSDVDCRGDRICDQGVCIDAGDDDDDDDGDDDDDDDDGPRPGPVGDGPSGDDDDDDGPSGSCSGSETQCNGSSSMSLCNEGQWQTASCDEVCGTVGLSSGSCAEDFCQCGEPTNTTCLNGVGALCACLQGTDAECTDDVFFDMYIDCHQGSFPEAACFADYIVEDTVQCADAAEACF